MSSRCMSITFRRFCTKLTPEQILARQQTLQMIESPPTIPRYSGSAVREMDPEYYLQNHPDPETALRIRAQMGEIAELMEKMNARKQTANQAIVWAATMFLTSSVAYGLYQLGDINTTLGACTPSLFHLFDFSTARSLLCTLASYGILPIDYASEDPYMIRRVEYQKRGCPKTRALRVCVPIGLGAGIDVDGIGPASLLKLGFGFMEVGTVDVSPSPKTELKSVHLLPLSIVKSKNRSEGSEGLEVVASRLCDYIECRDEDLLSRNSLTGISIRVSSPEDVAKIFQHKRLIGTVDFISLDVGHCDEERIVKIIDQTNKEGSGVTISSLPPIFLKLCLRQSLPPSESVITAINNSPYVVGVNINGYGESSSINASSGQLVFPQVFTDPNETLLVSGAMVREKSTLAVSAWYKAIGERKEIIASGGVYSGKDALEKLEAGASMVNVFTSFVLDGPQVARRIKTQLSVQLMNRGYVGLDDAIGAAHKKPSKERQLQQSRRKKF